MAISFKNSESRGTRKRFKDTLKASLKAFSINPDTWEEAATDRPGWRSLTHKGAVKCEEKHTLVAEERRLTRKLRASTVDPGGNHCMKSEFLCSLWQRKESFMPFMANCKWGFYVFVP